MITLDLTDEEQQMLRMVLDNYLSDLGMEIADTDNRDFRERLKARKAVLTKILAALPAAHATLEQKG